MPRPYRLAFVAVVILAALPWLYGADESPEQKPAENSAAVVADASADRAPFDLVVSPDGKWLVTANHASGTASLIQLATGDAKDSTGQVVHEIAIGEAPAAVAILPDGKHVAITASRSGKLVLLAVATDKLETVAEIAVGVEPRGIAISPDGKTAYVALTAEDKVAVVDLAERRKTTDIAVGRWPRYLCLSKNGDRLAVGCSGSGGVWFIDTAKREVAHQRVFSGLNLAHMAPSPDGAAVWFPWTFYGNQETTTGSIRQGWVMASRLGEVSFTNPETALRGCSLDPFRDAVADVHGFALANDGAKFVVTAAGTEELLIFRASDFAWTGIGGSEHMNAAMAGDKERFRRIGLGGRPLAVRLSSDGGRAYVANYERNSVQIVNLETRSVAEIPIGGPTTPVGAVRRGEAIFHDGHRSFEKWYSCHTCHYDAGPNSETIDTFNDGSTNTYKTIPSLYQLADTGPWTWHGWQKDLREAINGSFQTTMRGKKLNDAELDDVLAYLKAMPAPQNPHRAADGRLTESAERGKAVFHSAKAGCANCHSGSHATDGEIHEVGLEKPRDRYRGYNTPSLVDVQRRARLLHDGRARTLEKVLTGAHDPAKVTGQGSLDEQELRDLIDYLKTL